MKMTPHPEEGGVEPLHSVHLVQEAVKSTSTRSLSPLPPSYLPLLQISPYSKDPPDWESPTGVKVTDIVAHFEHLNKVKDHHYQGDGSGSGGSNSSRNESRSSGIFSDFEEDHDSQSWANLSRSSTPLRNNDKGTPSTTPTPVPRKLCFTNSSPNPAPNLDTLSEKLEEKIQDEDRVDNIDIDADSLRPEIEPEIEDEVTYVVEEINNNTAEYDHTHYSANQDEPEELADHETSRSALFKGLLTKLFSFTVFLHLLASGGLGAFLLGLRSSPKSLNYLKNFLQAQNIPQEVVLLVKNVLTNLAGFLDLSPKSLVSNDGLLLFLVGVTTLKFLGWYFIFRKSLFLGRTSNRGISVSYSRRLTEFLTNVLLVLLQPGLFLILRPYSSSDETANDVEDALKYEGQEIDAQKTRYSGQFEDSGFLEENFDPQPFSFDSALNADNSDSSTHPRQNDNLFLITVWLSLIQVTVITLFSFLLIPEKNPALESFLIFGQLPQLLIFLLGWPILAIFSYQKRKMD